jgi:hypothetical protein
VGSLRIGRWLWKDKVDHNVDSMIKVDRAETLDSIESCRDMTSRLSSIFISMNKLQVGNIGGNIGIELDSLACPELPQ